MTSHGARRHRNRREEEVDAAQGKFGHDFDEEQLIKEEGDVLMISEVYHLLKNTLANDRSSEPHNRDPMTMPVFKKCFDYCEMFGRLKDEGTARQVREELQEYGAFERIDEEGNVLPADDMRLQLTRHEMAQLVNLSVEKSEEAKVLIPTLVPKDDAQLQSLLDELTTKRKFQS